jgi:mono/diheme cytochrome c family protein
MRCRRVMSAIVCVGAADAQTRLERGGHLGNGILTCSNCHTPRGPSGVFLTDKQLSGGPQARDEPTFKVKGATITPDRETGI